MVNQSKYSLNVIIRSIVLFSMIFASCLIARAESTSQVTIKVSPEHTSKPVVRASRKNSETKYNVKIRPIKIIKPKTQNQGMANRTHGATASSGQSSKFKTDIKIIPMSETSSKEEKGRRQRSHSKKSKYSGKVGDISVSTSRLKEDAKSRPQINTTKKISPAVSNQKGHNKYDIKIGPNKALDTEQPEKIQSPISERIKVTRVRSWKLDESGRKTNEEIIDDKNVIEGINQPPSE